MSEDAKPAPADEVEREPSGRWVKGKSANKGGRPKGLGWHAQQRQLLREAVNPIYTALFAAAKAGDSRAAQILLAKVLPDTRNVDDEVGFKLKADTPAEQSRKVLAAMAAGKLTPGQAKDQLDVIQLAVRIVEGAELAEQVQAMAVELAALKGST